MFLHGLKTMIIIAHRGASGEYPENTLAAYEAAIEQHCDAIELDVFQVDQELLVYHDRFLDKLGYPNICLPSSSLPDIKQLSLPPERQILTLQEALLAIAGRCQVNIDIKYLEDIDLLINTLQKMVDSELYQMEQFLLSSFDHPMLLKIRKNHQHLRIGVLLASIPLEFDSLVKQLNPNAFHMDVDCLNRNAVESIHRLGRPVYVYTVDRETDLKTLNDWKVDGVFTNYPQRTRRYLLEVN